MAFISLARTNVYIPRIYTHLYVDCRLEKMWRKREKYSEKIFFICALTREHTAKESSMSLIKVFLRHHHRTRNLVFFYVEACNKYKKIFLEGFLPLNASFFSNKIFHHGITSQKSNANSFFFLFLNNLIIDRKFWLFMKHIVNNLPFCKHYSEREIFDIAKATQKCQKLMRSGKKIEFSAVVSGNGWFKFFCND